MRKPVYGYWDERRQKPIMREGFAWRSPTTSALWDGRTILFADLEKGGEVARREYAPLNMTFPVIAQGVGGNPQTAQRELERDQALVMWGHWDA